MTCSQMWYYHFDGKYKMSKNTSYCTLHIAQLNLIYHLHGISYDDDDDDESL